MTKILGGIGGALAIFAAIFTAPSYIEAQWVEPTRAYCDARIDTTARQYAESMKSFLIRQLSRELADIERRIRNGEATDIDHERRQQIKREIKELSKEAA